MQEFKFWKITALLIVWCHACYTFFKTLHSKFLFYINLCFIWTTRLLLFTIQKEIFSRYDLETRIFSLFLCLIKHNSKRIKPRAAKLIWQVVLCLWLHKKYFWRCKNLQFSINVTETKIINKKSNLQIANSDFICSYHIYIALYIYTESVNQIFLRSLKY